MIMAGVVATNPFKNMSISSWEPLWKVQARSTCEKCGKSRKFYCYSCCCLVNLKSSEIPCLHLPVKIDIIKHKLESASKSTAIHAKILAPDFVNIYEFPAIPDYDKSRVILVYPREDAYSCARFVEQLKKRVCSVPSINWDCLDTIVFIDSTWQQTHQILEHEKMQALGTVKLTEVETRFWRPQRKSSFHLSTIESIYYLLRELHSHFTLEKYGGQFDDLLYFFSYQYELVNKAMRERGTGV